MGCGASKDEANKPAEKGAAPAAQPAPAAAPAAAAQPAAPAKTKDERKKAFENLRKLLPRTKTPEDKNRRIELWKQVDQNGSGRVSLAEVDAMARRQLHLDDITNDLQPILMRAFEKANGMGANRGSSDFVEFLEFRLMLCYIYDYFELYTMFDEVDSSDDGRVSLEEFKKAVPMIEKWGLKMPNPEAVFAEIDTDKGGMILFEEFAKWASDKKLDADGDPDNES